MCFRTARSSFFDGQIWPPIDPISAFKTLNVSFIFGPIGIRGGIYQVQELLVPDV